MTFITCLGRYNFIVFQGCTQGHCDIYLLTTTTHYAHEIYHLFTTIHTVCSQQRNSALLRAVSSPFESLSCCSSTMVLIPTMKLPGGQALYPHDPQQPSPGENTIFGCERIPIGCDVCSCQNGKKQTQNQSCVKLHVIRSSGHQLLRSLSHQEVIKLLGGHQEVIRSLSHQVIRSSSHQVIIPLISKL